MKFRITYCKHGRTMFTDCRTIKEALSEIMNLELDAVQSIQLTRNT